MQAILALEDGRVFRDKGYGTRFSFPPAPGSACPSQVRIKPEHEPLAFIPPYSWFFWAVFLVVYVPEFRLIVRSKPQPGESTDRGSMNLILLVGWIAFPLAFYIPRTGRFNLAHPQVWFFAGLVVLICGSLLRRYCWRVLGRYFTGNVKIQEGQTVIQEGPYRHIRHPSYTGGMIMHLGTGLALTNWMSALILLAASAVGYAYRVHVEERHWWPAWARVISSTYGALNGLCRS